MDRPTDRQTDIATYRVAIAAKNSLLSGYARELTKNNANIKLNIFYAFTGRGGWVIDNENQMKTVKSLRHRYCQKETATN